MSKWPMRGHFGHLHFKTFPMTPRTPQGEVFCPLLLNSKDSGVPEDSKSPTLGVWVSSSYFAKVGLRQLWRLWLLWPWFHPNEDVIPSTQEHYNPTCQTFIFNPINEKEAHVSSIGLNILRTKACKLHGS
jgi:hypothetical protein